MQTTSSLIAQFYRCRYQSAKLKRRLRKRLRRRARNALKFYATLHLVKPFRLKLPGT